MKKTFVRIASLMLAIVLAWPTLAQRWVATPQDGVGQKGMFIAPSRPQDARLLALAKDRPRSINPLARPLAKAAKTAGVTVSVSTVPDTAFVTYDMGEECHHFYSLTMEEGVMQWLIYLYAQYGRTVTEDDIIRIYGPEEGSSFHGDTVEVLPGMEPARKYFIYVWALASAEDTVGIIFSTEFTGAVGGGTGTAAVTLNTTSDDEHIYLTATPNDQTGFFRIVYADSATLADRHWNTDSMAAQAAMQSLNYSGELTDTIAYLTPGTRYVVFAFPYNHNEELGNVATDSIRTTGTLPGGTGLATMSLNLHDFASTSVKVSAKMNDQTAYYYMFFAKTAQMRQYGLVTEDALADYCKEYTDRYYQDFTGQVTGLETGSEVAAWGIPYNRNDERGTCVHYTFVVGQGLVGITAAKAIKVAVHPNPTRNVLAIAADEPLQRADLLNAAGQRVRGQDVAATHASMDVSALPRGIYVLRLVGANGIATRKVVLQ